VPYRIDFRGATDEMLDRLVELGALDVELTHAGTIAALMPDIVTADQVARALGDPDITISPAVERDAGSVWILSPRRIRIGRLRIVPEGVATEPGTLRLIDAPAFGTGFHPTTALCLEALDDAAQSALPEAVLDVGTGSGILALGALMLGVPRAMAIDLDDDALRVAAENARINGLEERLQLAHGGPDVPAGTWPLVLANILAAPLIEMAPALVRRVGHHGRLVLSGIPSCLEQEVTRAYLHFGMRGMEVKSRAGWVALVLQASW
jgi:ribosomal protein L11 methyltransferase